MDIKPIKSESDYKRALRAIEQLWEAKPDTPESERLEILCIIIEAFEREHYLIPPPDPIAAIEHCMESRAHPERSRAVHRQLGAGLRGDGKAPPANLAHDPPPHRRTGDPHRRSYPTLSHSRSPDSLTAHHERSRLAQHLVQHFVAPNQRGAKSPYSANPPG